VIRLATSPADFALCAEIKNAVQPSQPVTADEFLADAGATLLLWPDAGYALVRRSPVEGCAFAMVRVVPARRRQGIGSALLSEASEVARGLGLVGLCGLVDGDDSESLGFVTRRRFLEIGRQVEQIRVLGAEPWPAPPVSIDLQELRSEYLRGVYAVAVEATRDMAVNVVIAAAPYEHWAEGLRGRIVHLALDRGSVVGYAVLAPRAAQPDVLEHEMTGVLRSHRRRGIAEALKRTQLAWAAAAGYRQLVTSTLTDNTAMRRLNLKLGYSERLAAIEVKGPLQ
jgi:GNAT superfamily N-acetyltransferase